ncbi:NUDIX hydrolase [Allosphingosinicella sp.]|jgi:8-oxo-dGTP pyrophosphatase MutT (NUDIX family)|uniref:NUDIX hydrolase n=1 Tax=Allosphingosinicella sp. TaxID=2823234 RepID=UPI002F0CED7A
MSDLPEPIPAATLILIRPARSGPPDLLLIERAGNMAFAAGALAFPGGRIDPGDEEAARGEALPDAAARIAAIRETIEETGIAVALDPPPDAATAQALRSGLAAGRGFLELLVEAGLSLDLDSLTPFARWCPNFHETRRFDTLFFLAEAPPGAEPTADSTESVRAFWASAAEALAEVESGRAHVIFPTRRNLERLGRFASIAEARADAERHPVRLITPWVEEREGGAFVCIPEDAGYPVTAEPLETARRR